MMWASQEDIHASNTYKLIGFYHDYAMGRDKVAQIGNSASQETSVDLNITGMADSIAITPKDNGSLITLKASIEKTVALRYNIETKTGSTGKFPFNIASENQITQNDILKDDKETYIVAIQKKQNQLNILFVFISRHYSELQKDKKMLEKLEKPSVSLSTPQTPSPDVTDKDKPQKQPVTFNHITTAIKHVVFAAFAGAVIGLVYHTLWQFFLNKNI